MLIMELSPFPHHGPLDPGLLPANQELVDDLVQRVTERRVTALLGPRRFGKTTALRSVAERLADAAVPVWLDLYELTSWADFAIRLDRAISSVVGPASSVFAEIAASVQLQLGVLGVEFRKPAAQRPDAMLTVHAQFDLLVKASARQPVVLIVDEFSGIVGVDGAAALMRTALQHHFQEIGLLFAGSEPSTMQMLFTDRAEPFYGQADLVDAPALSIETVDQVVREGFIGTGRSAGPIAAHIWSFTQGHPHRVMELADAVWRQVEPGEDAVVEHVVRGIDAVLAAGSAGMERLFSSLSTGEQLVLRSAAHGDSIFGPLAKSLGQSNGGAQHARSTLIDRGHLQRSGNTLTIVDPVLAEWVRRTFG